MRGPYRLAVAIVVALIGASALARAQSSATSEAVIPFKIQVPETMLRDLQARLQNTRFPQEIPNTNGTTAPISPICAHWCRIGATSSIGAPRAQIERVPQSRRQSTALKFISFTSSRGTACVPACVTHGAGINLNSPK